MSLIPISEVEFVKGKKINKKSIWNIDAEKRLRRKRRFYQEEYEDVFDLCEFILTLHDADVELNKKRKIINE